MASFLRVFALLCVFSEKLFDANALTTEEINAFKARPWIEVNTGKQGFVNTTVTSSSTLKILSNGVPDHETGKPLQSMMLETCVMYAGNSCLV